MEPTTAAARRPRKTPVKTLLLRSTHKLLPDITVAIARNRCTYLLVIPNPDPDQPNCCATYATLSLLVAENPFPGYSVQGNEMVWLKTYSENEGMAQQLAAAGWLRLTGQTIKQGYVIVPMCELMIKEEEMVNHCGPCGALGTFEEQFLRCSGCSRTYYCSEKCQAIDWEGSHKRDCKDIKAQRYAEVENRARGKINDILTGMGFSTVTLPA